MRAATLTHRGGHVALSGAGNANRDTRLGACLAQHGQIDFGADLTRLVGNIRRVRVWRVIGKTGLIGLEKAQRNHALELGFGRLGRVHPEAGENFLKRPANGFKIAFEAVAVNKA